MNVERLAVDLDIRGWVKNLSDGRVQLVGEAVEEALKDFLERIKQRFSVYISDIDLQWLAATGEFRISKYASKPLRIYLLL